MKALPVSQPWAELIVSGKKTIEIRTKNTNYRGWFYVYACRKDTKEWVVKELGFGDLPTGVIIGKAFLSKVKKYKSDKEYDKDLKFHLASSRIIEAEGWTDKPKYGYIVSKAERMTPVPFRGMPGFFEVKI